MKEVSNLKYQKTLKDVASLGFRSLSYSVFNLSKEIHRVYVGNAMFVSYEREQKCGQKFTGITVINS